MNERKVPEYQIRKSKDARFYFVTRDPGNHEVLSTSQMYEHLQSAIDGAIEDGCPDDQLPLAYVRDEEDDPVETPPSGPEQPEQPPQPTPETPAQ